MSVSSDYTFVSDTAAGPHNQPVDSAPPLDEAALIGRRSDDRRSFATRTIGGETLIVPVAGTVIDLESIYVVNPVGSRIWELLASPTTALRIAEVIAAEFDVPVPVAVADAVEFLESLRTRGLIQELTKGA
jgi:hypothetical protein